MVRPGRILFTESQAFQQWWLWALILLPVGIVAALFGWGVYTRFSEEGPWGMSPISDGWPIVSAMIALALTMIAPLLFVLMRLKVRVDGKGVHIRYVPFLRRTIRFRDIKTIEARTYRPIVEYGGWGIRVSWRHWGDRAYNVSGNRGVQLTLKDGKRILIGSQRPDELAQAIEGMVSSGS